MIKEMEILIPDEFTMNAFKNETEPLFNKIKTNQTQIRTLTALRDTLLPKLMSGEVRVLSSETHGRASQQSGRASQRE
jgi:type I restriction enzyme S subunit